MTRDQQGSARRSGRVDHASHVLPGQPPAAPGSAPESRDTSALTGLRSERRDRRASRALLERIRSSLSTRDLAILTSLSDYGLLRTTHLQALHFTGHATPDAAGRICRRVLQRLAVARLIEPIERRIGGIRAGSSAVVWRLGATGERALPSRADSPRARRREPSLRFLEHRMLVADVACSLHATGQAGQLEVSALSPEPGSWRRYLGEHGAAETLKPDLYAITASGEYEDHWFIEVDRGTESLPTLLRQCAAYERYRRSGTEQERSGVFPRVLWLLPDEHRRAALDAAIAAEQGIDEDLHRTATYEQLLPVVTRGAS